ncbi:pentatricopeptide repeat (PPR) superfamily protein [Actinidia rufa]|uniref:Pentatricopeptide repeat (PPR) superfamily protein n=1 Tax=Actinidia rufa TaxID=165716 RepID=A0A7J0GI39_9ERIC|nr:pentatricopeptide repeat (PPR) superfamily protein [Actinidia rufa]
MLTSQRTSHVKASSVFVRNFNTTNSLSSITASLSQARQAHAHILKTGLHFETHLTTRLLSLYANHLCFADADLVLDSITEPNLFSFSTLIYACSKTNRFNQVLSLFSRMLCRGLFPDDRVLPNAVKACSGLSNLGAGRQVHGIALVCGFDADSYVGSSLIHMYVKCGQLKDAHKLLGKMPELDVVSWSALIAGYARQGRVSEAKGVFDEMRNRGTEPNLVSWNGLIAGFNQSGCYSESVLMFQKMYLQGFKPDGTSISSVLPAVGDLEDLNMGVQIHGYVIKEGINLDKCVVVSALIDINGLVDEALMVFRQFKGKGMDLNVVSWTSVIASCSQNGKDMEALDLFREMQIAGVKPNLVTIPCLLPACGNIAALMHGKAAHCFSLRSGIFIDVYVGSALIDMYAKCGRIQSSRICFDRMPTRNLVCWNAILAGYAMHGKAKEAKEIFHLMQWSGQKPDFISFTCILAACSQSGLTEEGQYYFNSMSREHGIEEAGLMGPLPCLSCQLWVAGWGSLELLFQSLNSLLTLDCRNLHFRNAGTIGGCCVADAALVHMFGGTKPPPSVPSVSKSWLMMSIQNGGFGKFKGWWQRLRMVVEQSSLVSTKAFVVNLAFAEVLATKVLWPKLWDLHISLGHNRPVQAWIPSQGPYLVILKISDELDKHHLINYESSTHRNSSPLEAPLPL